MPEVRAPLRATELKPGQFFKVGDRWHRAASAVLQQDGHTRKIEVVSPIDGAIGWLTLHGAYVTVNEGNTIPSSFRSATLARKAKAMRAKAEELARTADRLEALSIEMDFVARDTANA